MVVVVAPTIDTASSTAITDRIHGLAFFIMTVREGFNVLIME